MPPFPLTLPLPSSLQVMASHTAASPRATGLQKLALLKELHEECSSQNSFGGKCRSFRVCSALRWNLLGTDRVYVRVQNRSRTMAKSRRGKWRTPGLLATAQYLDHRGRTLRRASIALHGTKSTSAAKISRKRSANHRRCSTMTS